MKQTKSLASGNTLEYEHKIVPLRGGTIAATFTRSPSQADVDEALAFVDTLRPPDSTLRVAELASGPNVADRHKRIEDSFLTNLRGGSTN